MKYLTYLYLTLFFLPFAASAQVPTPQTPQNFGDFVNIVLNIIQLIIPLFFALAFVVFLWGMAVFILKSGSEEGRENGKRLMVWGAIGFFVMLSIWGIVGILLGTFNLPLIFPQLRTS